MCCAFAWTVTVLTRINEEDLPRYSLCYRGTYCATAVPHLSKSNSPDQHQTQQLWN